MWNQQPSPVASSVTSSTPQTETSTTVDTVDAIECTALDLCATALTQHEIVNPRQLSMWILELEEPCGQRTRTTRVKKIHVLEVVITKLQQVQWLKDRDGFVFVVKVFGTPIAHDWRKSVHKPLLSAGNVTDKGHALWLDGNVGYIIQKNSPILTAMRTCFQRVCEQHSWNGAIDLTKERGVYNLYVQVAGGDGNIGQAVDVSPNEM